MGHHVVRIRWVALAAMIWWAPGIAPAQAPTTAALTTTSDVPRPWAKGVSERQQAQALALFLSGNEDFAESRFVQAIAKYREALLHWDHPAIRFNIAVCLINMDQPVAAADNVERSLAFGPAPLGAAMYSQGVTYRKLLDAQLVHLKVACPVAGARVTIDGRPLLTGPGEVDEVLMPGEHQIVAIKPGFEISTETLVLSAGKPQTYQIASTFEPKIVEVSVPCTTGPASNRYNPPANRSVAPKAQRLQGTLSMAPPPNPAVQYSANAQVAANKPAAISNTQTAAIVVPVPPQPADAWIPAGTMAPTPSSYSAHVATAPTAAGVTTAALTAATTPPTTAATTIPSTNPALAAAQVSLVGAPTATVTAAAPSSLTTTPPTTTESAMALAFTASQTPSILTPPAYLPYATQVPMPATPGYLPASPTYVWTGTPRTPLGSAYTPPSYSPPVYTPPVYTYTPPMWQPPAPPRPRGSQPGVPGAPDMPGAPSGLPFPPSYPVPPIPASPSPPTFAANVRRASDAPQRATIPTEHVTTKTYTMPASSTSSHSTSSHSTSSHSSSAPTPTYHAPTPTYHAPTPTYHATPTIRTR